MLNVDRVPPLVAGCLLRQCGGVKTVWLPADLVHDSLSNAYLAAQEAGTQRAELLEVLQECGALLGQLEGQQALRERVRTAIHQVEHAA